MPEAPRPSPEENLPKPVGFKRPEEEQYLNPIVARVKRIINRNKVPSNLGYKSMAEIFGGKLTTDEDGKMVYDKRGLVSTLDRIGDPRVREVDDHVSNKDKLSVWRRNKRWFFRHYFTLHHARPFAKPEGKRYRAGKEETMAHIKQLGLEDYYGEHSHGFEVKKPEIFTNGVNLFDIWRSDQIHSPLLDKVDRFEALKQAVQYVRSVHDNHGGIGELLANDIIFQDHAEDGTVSNPVLNLPDIVYNPRKNFGRHEQRATDMLDFMVGMSTEELRRSGDWDQVQKVLTTIKDGYGPEDPQDSVIKWTGLLARRGRLTLEENGLSKIHNFARLGLTKGISARLRQTIIDTCLSNNEPQAQV